MIHRLAVFALFASALLLPACSGSSGSGAPPQQTSVALSGVLIDAATGAPRAGVLVVTGDGDPVTVTVDPATGAWSVAGLAPAPMVHIEVTELDGAPLDPIAHAVLPDLTFPDSYDETSVTLIDVTRDRTGIELPVETFPVVDVRVRVVSSTGRRLVGREVEYNVATFFTAETMDRAVTDGNGEFTLRVAVGRHAVFYTSIANEFETQSLPQGWYVGRGRPGTAVLPGTIPAGGAFGHHLMYSQVPERFDLTIRDPLVP